MPGLVPGIHVLRRTRPGKTWMAGTSPAMTESSVLVRLRLGVSRRREGLVGIGISGRALDDDEGVLGRLVAGVAGRRQPVEAGSERLAVLRGDRLAERGDFTIDDRGRHRAGRRVVM